MKWQAQENVTSLESPGHLAVEMICGELEGVMKACRVVQTTVTAPGPRSNRVGESKDKGEFQE